MFHLTVNVPTKDLNLYTLTDVQVGGQGFADKAYREYVKEAASDPIGRAFGGGDYTDGISPSNRKLYMAAYVKGDVYDTFAEMLRAGSDAQVDEFIRLTAPLQGKVDFWLKGHHLFEYIERRRAAGRGRNADEMRAEYIMTSSDQRIADTLGGVYFGEPGGAMGEALITYRFPSARAGQPRPELKMFAMHGQGSGQTFAAPVGSLEKQMRAHTADIYFTGHHHKLVAAAGVKLHDDPSSETHLGATDSRLVGGGSWLRGFMLNTTTYAEDGAMVPLAIGAPIIHVHRNDDDTFRVRAEI